MTEETLRILLVDDHPLVREGLRALLTSLPGMSIVGEADNGEEAVTKASELQPDIILMDLQMHKLNVIEATRRILQANPHIGILALTMLEDDDSVFGAMRAGARGYILKGAGKSEVVRAISVVAHGQDKFSPQIAQRLTRGAGSPAPLQEAGRERPTFLD